MHPTFATPTSHSISNFPILAVPPQSSPVLKQESTCFLTFLIIQQGLTSDHGVKGNSHKSREEDAKEAEWRIGDEKLSARVGVEVWKMELEKEELTKTWRGLDVPAYETVGEDGPTRRHPMKPREIGVNRDGNETVVFISGFPDVHGMFDDVIADLKVKHRCVEMITPFMDEPNRNQFFGNQAKPWPPRTLSIDDVVGLTEQVIDRVLETDQGEQVSIICHDFGVVWATGAVHRNPEKFLSLIHI